MYLQRQAQSGLQRQTVTVTLPTTAGGEVQQTAEALPAGSVQPGEVWAATLSGPVVGAALAGATVTSTGELWVEVKYIPIAASAGWTPVVTLSRVA